MIQLAYTEQDLLHYEFSFDFPSGKRRLLSGLPLPVHLHHTTG